MVRKCQVPRPCHFLHNEYSVGECGECHIGILSPRSMVSQYDTRVAVCDGSDRPMLDHFQAKC